MVILLICVLLMCNDNNVCVIILICVLICMCINV